MNCKFLLLVVSISVVVVLVPIHVAGGLEEYMPLLLADYQRTRCGLNVLLCALAIAFFRLEVLHFPHPFLEVVSAFPPVTILWTFQRQQNAQRCLLLLLLLLHLLLDRCWPSPPR